LDKDFVQLIMSPLYFTSDIKGVPFDKVMVKPEIARNQFLACHLAKKISGQYRLELPIKNKYSKYDNKVSYTATLL